MELCDSCKNRKCSKNIIIIEQDNLRIIKCLEYEKNKEKIQGYKEQLYKTARQYNTLMQLNI